MINGWIHEGFRITDYWIGGEAPSGIPDDGTDIGAITEGYVSITPLDLDLTAYRRTQMLSHWPWELVDTTALKFIGDACLVGYQPNAGALPVVGS